MAKRSMGKRIYREPTSEQAEKYRRIREMIAGTGDAKRTIEIDMIAVPGK